MKTFRMQAKTRDDGSLDIHVMTGYVNAIVEVQMIIHPIFEGHYDGLAFIERFKEALAAVESSEGDIP